MFSNTKSGIGGKVLTATLLVLFFAASSAVVTSAVDIYVPEGENQNIQQAVNNASTGDTIIVHDGTYNENVYVNVTNLAIRSENGPGNCIVNAKYENTDVFFVAANYVTITGFTVQGATEFGYAGICLYDVGYCHISGNNVLNNGDGISILDSGYNSVANNIVTNNNYTGIYLELADANIVMGNTATNNGWEGIFLASSYNNTFIGNNASNNTIYDFYSDEYSQDNTVKDLQLCNNQTSVSFTYGNGAGLKSVDTVPTEPSEKLDISKYVETIEVCADSWLFLNMSYEEADLGCVAEDSLSMWEHIGTDWVEVTGTTGVNTAENYVYANITEFNIIAPLGDSNGLSIAPLGSSNGLNCTFGDLCVNASGWWPDNGTFNANTTQPIQLAINNASTSDTVYVYNGSYTENVNVNKQLTLQGEGADVVTVTAASSSDHVFEVTANYVNISGFNVTGATGTMKAGFYIGSDVNHCNISDNNVSDNTIGIYLNSLSNDNTFTNNTVSDNTWDLRIASSTSAFTNNTLNGTTIDFTYSGDVSLRGVTSQPNDPLGRKNISGFINATNHSASAWILMNFSYSDSEVSGLDESSLKVWKHNGTAWVEDGWNGTRYLDTTNNVVGVNITSFSVFAPMAATESCQAVISSYTPAKQLQIEDERGASLKQSYPYLQKSRTLNTSATLSSTDKVGGVRFIVDQGLAGELIVNDTDTADTLFNAQFYGLCYGNHTLDIIILNETLDALSGENQTVSIDPFWVVSHIIQFVGDSITISNKDDTIGDVYDLADAQNDSKAVTSDNLLELPCWDNDDVVGFRAYSNGIHIFYSDYAKSIYRTDVFGNNAAQSGITAEETHDKFVDNFNGYADRFTSLDGNISNANLFGPTHAYVMLGLNDKRLSVTEATYETQLSNVVNDIHNQGIAYENITLLYPTYSPTYDVLNYLDNIDNVASNLGTRLITDLYHETKDNYETSGKSWYFTDDLHFTRAGSKNISRIIAENSIFTAGLTCTCGNICVNESGWWRDGGVFNASGTRIQAAVDNATAGETIYVYNGSYTENVNVNKQLTLEGEGRDVVNVTAASVSDHVFNVTANYVNISGFNVTGATERAGIQLYNSVEHCNISNNSASNNYYGFWLNESSSNNFTRNIANSNSNCGVFLTNADSNNITCNWVYHNTQRGFYLTGGCMGNNISHNNIIANGALQANGSYLWQFYNDQQEKVNASHNWWGMENNETRINASIYDWNNDNTTGNVTVLPRLCGAAPCAPIPELSTAILLGMGLLLLAGYLRIRRKR